MIENRKTLVLMGAAALLAIAVYITLALMPQKAGYDFKQDQISLLSINPVDVSAANTRFNGERHEYKQTEGKWYRDGELEDYNAADLRITYITYLYSDNLVTSNAQDLSVYGLAEPSAEASFETFSNERHTVLFGIETVDRKSRYMTVDGQNTVYTLPTEAFDVIFK